MSTRKVLLRVTATFAIVLVAFAGYVVWRNRLLPQTEQDSAILRATLELLSRESRWARDDDRNCEGASEALSLYCALRAASLEVTGEFRHRAAALQAVRREIERSRPNRDYSHRLMGFNNDPEVTFAEMRSVLERALMNLESGEKATAD